MFGRKRKKQVDGQVCPLCQLVNPHEAEACTRCYYEFTVAAHRQMVNTVESAESGGLFDALLEEDEALDEEAQLVDWTGHSFTMDDMTVEVSQYGEDGLVEVDQNVSMEHQFDAPQQVARVKQEVIEEEDYILTAADAPEHVEKFEVGDGPDLSFQKEEYRAPVVKLVEMTESEDRAPVASASEIPDETDYVPAAKPAAATPVPSPAPAPAPSMTPAPTVTPAAPTVPVVPLTTPAPAAAPPAAAFPSPSVAPVSVPSIPQPAAANGAVAPVELDLDPAPAPVATATAPPTLGMWPWPQAEPWEDAQIRKHLRETMEAAKEGRVDDAKRGLVTLGPHLGDRVDLVFHIGVLLKRFGQEGVMRRMIETARTQHPESPEVAKAVQHLLA